MDLNFKSLSAKFKTFQAGLLSGSAWSKAQISPETYATSSKQSYLGTL